jgi:hypothetical protein
MKMKDLLLAWAVFAGLGILSGAESTCFAGHYSSGAAYRAPSHPPAYGFRSNGQSFTYQPSGSAYSYGTRGGPAGFGLYGPQYRFDNFTSPRNAPSYKTPMDNQPYYFSGRMWYPRPY